MRSASSGLQNYGIINNPYLSAYLTPATEGRGRHRVVQRRHAERDRERGLQRHRRGGEQAHRADQRRASTWSRR
jgi:hypothetical protein